MTVQKAEETLEFVVNILRCSFSADSQPPQLVSETGVLRKENSSLPEATVSLFPHTCSEKQNLIGPEIHPPAQSALPQLILRKTSYIL